VTNEQYKYIVDKNFKSILPSISSNSTYEFLYKYDVSAAFPNYMYVEKAAKMTFVRKTQTYNVDEIDT